MLRRGRQGSRAAACALTMATLTLFSASAQAAPPTSLQTMSDLNTVIGPIIRAANGMTGSLVGLGESFLAFAVLVELFMMVVTYFIEPGVQELMVKAAILGLKVAAPLALLLAWPTPIVKASQFFSQTVFSVFGVGSSTTLMSNAITQLMQSFGQMLIPLPTSSHIWTWKLWDIPEAAGSFIGSLFMAIGADIILLFIVGGATVLLVIAFFMALYGPLLFIALGLIFGPILLCWLPMTSMSWLAKRWIKFMIASYMALIVGAAIAGIFVTAIGAIAHSYALVTNGISSVPVAVTHMMIFMVPVVAIILFMFQFILQFERIAEALTGGKSSSKHNAASTMHRVGKTAARVAKNL